MDQRVIDFIKPGLLLLSLCLIYVVIGVKFGSDTHKYFTKGSILLEWLSRGFRGDINYYNLFYTLPSLVAVFAKSTSLDSPGRIFLLVNFLYFSVAAGIFLFVLQKYAAKATWLGSAFVLYLLLGMPDISMWHYYVLSDSIYISSMICFWSAAVVYILTDNKQSLLVLFAALVLCLLSRPTAVVLVPFALIMFLLKHSKYLFAYPKLMGTVFIAVPLCFTLIMWPGLIYLKSIGNSLGSFLVVDIWLEHYNTGVVVYDRFETYFSDVSGYLDYFRMTLNRFFYYYYPLRQGYSLAHNVLVAVYFIFYLGFAVVGGRQLYAQSTKHRLLLFLCLLSTLYYGLFHALMAIDYDWRFQISAQIPIWVIALWGILSTPRLFIHEH